MIVPQEKSCRTCSAVKPLDQFKPDKQCTSGYTNECLECCRARNRAYARGYRLRPEVQARVYEWRTADERKAYQRVKYRDLKEEVIEEYGGCCNCCGEPNLAFLTIDHIFNDGANHRGEGGRFKGVSIYRTLKREGFPKGRYQVLCYNCNCAKQHDTEGHRHAHPRAKEIDGFG